MRKEILAILAICLVSLFLIQSAQAQVATIIETQIETETAVVTATAIETVVVTQGNKTTVIKTSIETQTDNNGITFALDTQTIIIIVGVVSAIVIASIAFLIVRARKDTKIDKLEQEPAPSL